MHIAHALDCSVYVTSCVKSIQCFFSNNNLKDDHHLLPLRVFVEVIFCGLQVGSAWLFDPIFYFQKKKKGGGGRLNSTFWPKIMGGGGGGWGGGGGGG